MECIGRYQIVKELGRGAMGIVFQAVDPTIGRTVAIKTIRLSDVTNTQERNKLRERLFREARSAGILSHPNIVTIYDMQEEDDLTYIAMEFVDGPTLDALMSEAKAIPKDGVLRILRESAAGLDYAHQKGIVHRDIKPANIMLDATGKVKITDFGIAKVTSSEQFTMTGTIVGTPNYMSPEQVQGLPTVDGRADQFSLGVIAFEMLTGEKPFAGEHLTTVVYKIVAGDPAPPQRLNPTLGPSIDSVLRKALAKKADARYLSCLEFVNALDKACSGTPGWTNLTRGGSQDMPTLADMPHSPAGRPTRPSMPPPRPKRDESTATGLRRKKTSALTMALAILVAAGLVVLIAWQAAPWLIDTPRQESAQSSVPQAASPPSQQPQPPADKPSPSKAAETPVTPAATTETKPSEPGPAPSPAAETKPDIEAPPASAPKSSKTAQARIPGPPQAIGIVTSPAGALAALDGRSATSCRTPCTLLAPPGRHTIQITHSGHQTEFREIEVTNGPQDLPTVMLHADTGTLLLTSVPSGAAVAVNGKPVQGQVTPAQLALAPGNYSITLTKDGRSVSRPVQIRNGIMATMKIFFDEP
jgi:serine/threonine protein kinase